MSGLPFESYTTASPVVNEWAANSVIKFPTTFVLSAVNVAVVDSVTLLSYSFVISSPAWSSQSIV